MLQDNFLRDVAVGRAALPSDGEGNVIFQPSFGYDTPIYKGAGLKAIPPCLNFNIPRTPSQPPQPPSQLRHQPHPRPPHKLVILIQRTQLKEPLPRARHQGRALVRQIDKLVQPKAVDQIVHEHRAVGKLGLAHDRHGPRLVQEQVVHQARPPRADAVRAAVPHVADEAVAAAVKVAGGVVGADSVLLFLGVCVSTSVTGDGVGEEETHLGPIHLKIRKLDPLEPRQQRNLVRIRLHSLQVRAVLLARPALVPTLRHARVVLPGVEQVDVFLGGDVERDHGKGLAQVWDPATVDDGAGRGLGAPQGVEGGGGGGGVGEGGRGVGGERGEGERGVGFGGPDGAGAEGGGGGLPEGGAEDEEFGGGWVAVGRRG